MTKRSRRRPTSQPSSRSRPTPRRVRRGFNRTWLLVGAGTALIVAAAIVFIVVYNRTTPPATPAASTSSSPAAAGSTVDGIKCEQMEQVFFHIHAHLAIFVGGQPRTVPSGIGVQDAQVQQTPEGPFVVSGSCFSWLHSHTADGLIHVESPVQRTFTLGDYFDVWGQPLTASRLGPDTGPVIAYVNGQRYTGDPRSIPLQAHAVIQLDVGSDVAPIPYTFPPNA